jgi:hypothetical protein
MKYRTNRNEVALRWIRRKPKGGLGSSAVIIGVIGLSTLFCPAAEADCGSAAAQAAMAGNAMQGKPFTLSQEPALQPDADLEQNQPLHEEEHEANPSIVGFWKTTFTSGGIVFNVGYDQFHPDGSENSVDSPAPSTGNVCLGVWEKVGRRSYVVLHPAFNWDAASGKVVSIYIQRVKVTVSPDGKTFAGTFTGDSYDFNGNFLTGSHVEGPVTGARITVRGRFPFPFPF